MQIIYMLSEASEAGLIISTLGALISYVTSRQTKEKKTQKIFGGLAGLFVAVLLVFLVAQLWMKQYTKVPNVVNLPKSDAISSRYAADLEVDIPSGTAENAIVISQNPTKGEIVNTGHMVSLKFKAQTKEPPETKAPETEQPATEEPTTEPTEDTKPTATKVSPGDVLTIGTYAGKSLDWKVLDVSGTKAFLLSTKAIKETAYHDTKEVTVTWGECSLRKWLNGAFLTTAFSKDEQAAILTTTVDNGADQGNQEWSNSGSGDTKDKIFLLSYAEFKRYVEGTDFSICEAAYSTKPGEDDRVKLLDNGTEAAFWWLRSQGINGKQAAYINFEGKCFSNYATNWYISARPAMWVDVEKLANL